MVVGIGTAVVVGPDTGEALVGATGAIASVELATGVLEEVSPVEEPHLKSLGPGIR